MDLEAISAAARLLEAGRLVGMPTETVYGLAADASNPDAVAAIFAAKGRPSNHPVIVHVARGADLSRWAAEVPPEAKKLIDAFWPGPLTLILKRAASVPAAVTGGQDSVGLRCPAHPVAQALLHEFRQGQGGLAAPSANRFGRVSPTTAQHVIDEFGAPGDGPLAAVLEGGSCDVGIESTIVDLTRLDTLGPVLLRPGQVSAAQLEQALGLPLALPDRAAPRVSGSLDAHYAPTTPVALAASADVERIAGALQAKGKRVVTLRCTGDAHAYAHALYANLRALDRDGANLILVEQPPQDPAWQGVNDRLRRAAYDSAGVVERLLG
ncbi:MAG: L-threonylcarbamoyladenylate synthase [Burkholderiaceae bacterium]|nr:L-threonylcarbamoyladenylate synthase [Burkholderiaceae bacterium]